MAKMMLNQKLKAVGVDYIKVFSAGINSVEGQEMTKQSVAAIKKLGYKKERHKSSRIQALNLNEYTIFTLTDAHKVVLGIRCKSARDVLGSDILDPFLMPQDIYDECARQIEKFCGEVIKLIVTVEVK
jgi:protein-tyrosine-phosphatase